MIEEWLNDYGELTSFSFMVYSYYGVRDNAIINFGLTDKLMNSSMADVRYCQTVDEINEELAGEYHMKRGLNIQWIFPKKVHPSCKKMIIEIISEGLDHLNIAYDLFGVFGDAN